MVLKTVIINGVIISAILSAVFASQLPYFKRQDSHFVFPKLNFPKNGLISKTTGWLKPNAFDFNKVGEEAGGEVAKRKDLLQEEFTQQKNNLEKKSSSTVKNFIAEKFLGAIGVKPEDLLSDEEIKQYQSRLQCTQLDVK